MSFFGWFKKAAKGIWGLLKRFLQSDDVQALIGSALGGIVEQVVLELQGADYASLSNAQKRAEAFRRIAERARAGGLEFRDSLVGLLIELVINRIKGVPNV